jgi:hypothetical protein
MFIFEPSKPEYGLQMEGYYIWCSSVIYCAADGLYHMFASRWSNTLPFHPGWLTNSEVIRAVSPNMLGPFEFQEVVLPARGAQYWDGCAAHNPRVLRYGDKYLLYYVGMTYPFPMPEAGADVTNADAVTVVARASKRIGVAVADSLSGPWQRFDKPVLDVKPNTYYSFLTSNPSPLIEADGSIYMMFKSRAYLGHKHSSMSIGVARAPGYDVPFTVLTDEPVFSTTNFGEVEDPFVWINATGEYEMVAKDMAGTIGGTAADGISATSKDGIIWTNPQKSYTRTVEYDNGIVQNFALLERPFLLIENGKPQAFYAAVAKDHPYGDNKRSSTWNIARKIIRVE